MKKNKGILVYLLVAVAFVFFAAYMLPRLNKTEPEHLYSEIIRHFDELEVTHYTLDLGSGDLELTLKGEEEPILYEVPNVSIFLEDTEDYQQRYDKANPDAPLEQDYYKITDNSWIITYIPTIIILIMGIVLFVFMMRQAGGGRYTAFGKVNVKNQAQGKRATFADVAGAEEEKQEVAEIVDFLKDPKKYTELGARIPRGVLLLGPPGTGKTLLARAVAGEADCPFYPISASDFVEMFVGVGASRVRDLFETAKKTAPSIIFIDEIDAVGRHRGTGLGGGHDEREQTLNQLLVEMDGFAENESVIVMAATNRRDILDPALLRPGRFDRQIMVGYPDVKGREEILRVHTKNKPVAPDVNLRDIARSTVGFTGADLENLCNEAALLAARVNRKAITNEDIAEATIKVVVGPEKKSRIKNEREIKLTAYHEAGHAVCHYYCPHTDNVYQISIIPRGSAGGYTMSLPDEDKTYMSRMEMSEEIVTLLGGRVAEELVMDDISTGASNDLERATATARRMITRYGFSKRLGAVVYGSNDTEPFLGRDFNSTPSYSDRVASLIDEEISSIVEESYKEATKILSDHMDQLTRVAEYLIRNEKVDSDVFKALMEGRDPSGDAAAPEEPETPDQDAPKETDVQEILDFTEN